jgi:hypothetical protein
MKIFLPLIFVLSITVSAQKKQLVPYSNIYKDEAPHNYTDSNIKIEYLVNADTNDHSVYLKITKGRLKRTLKFGDFIGVPPCYYSELAFYYDSLVYLMGPQCMNDRDMTIVNLNNPKRDKDVIPLFIDKKDSILVYDSGYNNHRFYVTKFNFITQKEIQIPDIYSCANIWDCFENITYKDCVLSIEYLAQPNANEVKKELKFR